MTLAAPALDPRTRRRAAALAIYKLRLERVRTIRRQEAEAEARATSQSLMDFIPAISPRFERPVHLQPMVDELDAIVDGTETWIVTSTPPRHGKTEAILHFIAKMLRRRPATQIAYITYGADLSMTKSRRARGLARAAGVQLLRGAGAVRNWETTAGGGLHAAGLQGDLTGRGYDVVIIDDPHKNRVEAESLLMRERVWDLFTDAAFTRLEPGGSVIVNMARWHPDDLAGRLIEQGWRTVRLSAIGDDETPLWPTRWPLANLERIRGTVGEYSWASLYQGRPRARGGAVFRDVYFHDPAVPLPSGYRIVIGVDLAYTAKSYADYSVAVVMAAVGDKRHVLEVHRAQVEAPQFGALLQQLQARTGGVIYTYVHGTETGATDFLRSTYKLRIDAKPASADKFVRAQPVAAAWNLGDVTIPAPVDGKSPAWVEPFATEVTGFTGVKDRHDDQVDALASAFDALHSGISIWSM